MRINIKRLRRTADKMHMTIAEELTADGGKLYRITGGILGDTAENYASTEDIRDRLESLHALFIEGMNASATAHEEEAEELEIIEHPAQEPEYLKLKGYKQRAEAMGLTISTEATADGGKLYRITGKLLDDLEEDTRTFTSPQALRAEINSLWDIVTEPEQAYWDDASGRTHTQLIYPDAPR